MILRSNRDDLARLLRHLAAGVITNDQFVDGAVPLFDVRDPAIEGVFWEADGLYSDLRTYRLRGRDALTRDERRAVARAIVFLHSDVEYSWPVPKPARSSATFFVSALVAGVSVGTALTSWTAGLTCSMFTLFVGWFVAWAVRTWRSRHIVTPVSSVSDWPFASAAELQAARRHPRYLRDPAIA